jgi:hypothetical protein
MQTNITKCLIVHAFTHSEIGLLIVISSPMVDWGLELGKIISLWKPHSDLG